MSRYLSDVAVKGLRKIGDAYIPGGEGFPSFSDSGVARDADRALEFIPEEDRRGLVLVLKLFAWAPRWMVRGVLQLIDDDRWFPNPLGSFFRLLKFGLKGIVYTLYYSNPKVHPLIQWDASVTSEVIDGSR